MVMTRGAAQGKKTRPGPSRPTKPRSKPKKSAASPPSLVLAPSQPPPERATSPPPAALRAERERSASHPAAPATTVETHLEPPQPSPVRSPTPPRAISPPPISPPSPVLQSPTEVLPRTEEVLQAPITTEIDMGEGSKTILGAEKPDCQSPEPSAVASSGEDMVSNPTFKANRAELVEESDSGEIPLSRLRKRKSTLKESGASVPNRPFPRPGPKKGEIAADQQKAKKLKARANQKHPPKPPSVTMEQAGHVRSKRKSKANRAL